MDTTDANLRKRMVSLRFRRDELGAETSVLSQRQSVITTLKVELLAVVLRDRLQNGSPDLPQFYARLLLT
ncbi:hypothetical protein M3P36_12960 [Altererythrobacter sp. KTW20L]|uniref:hypothetical protein n=1 Tax=Altererythrobacter sp. KTW20L TaxID=2942210 RepID=UPI0020BF86B5|nr:hypothetical protein [Altererythrobacter sp. KTW20L]MCL6251949.1 hypothetical protein [Altererythrobacter sp. KTW20L]